MRCWNTLCIGLTLKSVTLEQIGFHSSLTNAKDAQLFYFVRAIDLPNASKHKRIFHVPLMILPGPRELCCVDLHMDIVVKDFENW